MVSSSTPNQMSRLFLIYASCILVGLGLEGFNHWREGLFCTYLMIWASACRNSSRDSLPSVKDQQRSLVRTSCFYGILKIPEAKQLPYWA